MKARATIAFLAAASFALLASRSYAQQPQTPETKARNAMVGTQAPKLDAGQWINTDGKTLSLAGLRGKVVVLDFFAFW